MITVSGVSHLPPCFRFCRDPASFWQFLHIPCMRNIMEEARHSSFIKLYSLENGPLPWALKYNITGEAGWLSSFARRPRLWRRGPTPWRSPFPHLRELRRAGYPYCAVLCRAVSCCALLCWTVLDSAGLC